MEIPTKENLVMITVTTTVIGNVTSTRSRIAILSNEVTCNHNDPAPALHLQSYLSKKRTNTVRKIFNPLLVPKVTLAFATAVYL